MTGRVCISINSPAFCIRPHKVSGQPAHRDHANENKAAEGAGKSRHVAAYTEKSLRLLPCKACDHLNEQWHGAFPVLLHLLMSAPLSFWPVVSPACSV